MTYGTPSYATTSPTTAIGMNEIVGILKEIYDGQKVQIMTYTDNPFLALVRKMTRFGGKLYPLPILQEGLPNATASFANAQSNTAAVTLKEFILTRVQGFQVAQIGHEAMLAATSDEMSFINGVKLTVDQTIQAAVNFVAASLARSGTGSIGKVSAIATGVITLADPNSVVQFQLGQVLQANATDGGGSPRAALGYVIGLDRGNGKVTVSASAGGAAGTPAGWAASDYLLVQGNNNATITGVPGWLNAPNVASNDSFFGVNRYADITRLAGVYWDGSAQSIEEAVIDATSLVAREGGKPEVGITNFGSYSALEKSLGSKVTYTQLTTEIPGEAAKAEIGFRGIMVNGANSQVRIFPDRNWQGFRMDLLTMDTWELLSLKECPHIFDYGDNVQMLRMGSNNAAELRVGFYAQLGCVAPGRNAWVNLGQ